jgi:dTDP-4-dehydrorhamnose 3,5-epimerase
LIFSETKLKGAFVIDLEKLEDERGFFGRLWDKKEFEIRRLDSDLVQCSTSFNKKKGTLRGLHYQKPPHEETKIVRCTRGKIFDVIVDLRRNSKTFKDWIGVELSEENYKMIYIPKGFAHGFQTLTDNTEVFYQISQYFMQEYSSGLRWNDTAFNIEWPFASPTIISEKDSSYSNFEC